MGIVSQSRRMPPPPAPAGTGTDVPLRKLVFPALGTMCEIQYAAPSGDAQAAGFERAVTAWVNAFEAKY
jgi:hypothetical protein